MALTIDQITARLHQEGYGIRSAATRNLWYVTDPQKQVHALKRIDQETWGCEPLVGRDTHASSLVLDIVTGKKQRTYD